MTDPWKRRHAGGLVETGTICGGNVTVIERRPIGMVIPILKKKVLGVGQQQEAAAAQ